MLDVNLANSFKHGPGLWKFNNSLLSDEGFCTEIRSVIDRFSEFKHVFLSAAEFWESLKADLKHVSIQFSRSTAKNRAYDRVTLTNKLIKLKALLVAGDTSVKPDISRTETDLNALYSKEMEGAKIRSRAQWLEEGEAPCKRQKMNPYMV